MLHSLIPSGLLEEHSSIIIAENWRRGFKEILKRKYVEASKYWKKHYGCYHANSFLIGFQTLSNSSQNSCRSSTLFAKNWSCKHMKPTQLVVIRGSMYATTVSTRFSTASDDPSERLYHRQEYRNTADLTTSYQAYPCWCSILHLNHFG